MRQRRWTIPAGVMIAMMAAGCGRSGPAEPTLLQQRLDRSDRVVQRSIEAIGGLDRWQQVDRIGAMVLLSIWDKQGRSYTNRYALSLQLGPGRLIRTLRAVGQGGEGTQRITVQRVGPPVAYCPDLSADVRQNLMLAFQQLLHRLAGPWNLLQPGVESSAAKPARLIGEDVLRIHAMGEGTNGTYDFQPVTALLRAITTPSEPGHSPGSVTLLDYRLHPNGLAFPDSVNILRRGDLMTVSEEKQLRVQLYDVQFGHTME